MAKLIALFCFMITFGGCNTDGLTIPFAEGADMLTRSTPDFTPTTDAGKCPVLNPGDIFTVSQHPPTEYIINRRGKAMYFPYKFQPDDDDGVYHSWRGSEAGLFTISISQDCFDTVQVPSNYPGGVNLRPGSFVVKRPSSSQLYVILPDNTRAPVSPQVVATLYAPAYSGGENDTALVYLDVFWPNLVNVAPEIIQAHVHPGMLFVVDSGEVVYYADSDGSIRVVTGSGFTANHFQHRLVRRVPLSATQGMLLGKAISGQVPAIDDPTQGG